MLCQNHPQFVDEDEKNVLHQWDYNKTQYTLILIISSCYVKIIKKKIITLCGTKSWTFKEMIYYVKCSWLRINYWGKGIVSSAISHKKAH